MNSPDGRECSEFHRKSKIVLSGKQTSTLYLANGQRQLIEQIVVDGCAITEGRRCDWLMRLTEAPSREEIFVELKGKGVSDGIEQLRTSTMALTKIEHFCSAKLAQHSIAFFFQVVRF